MPRTNLKLYATDALGTATTTTINYANPDAKNADYLEFARMLNQFTINTYDKTEKIVTTELDTETEKQTPTFTVSKANIVSSDFTTQGSNFKCLNLPTTGGIQLNYNGDGNFYVKDLLDLPSEVQIAFHNKNRSTSYCQIWYYTGATPSNFSFTIGTTETQNYESAEITITVTV